MSWTFAKTPETSTMYQDDKSDKMVIDCEVQTAVAPGDLAAFGTSVGYVKPAISSGANVPIGFVGDNPNSVVFSTGAQVDRASTSFEVDYTVPIIRHGLCLAKSDSGGITAGQFLMVAGVAGQVNNHAGTATQVGQALTTAAAVAGTLLVVDVNIVGTD